MTSNGGKRWEPGDKIKDRENAEMSVSTNDPVCARCKGTSSMIWQRDQRGAVICLDCHAAEKAAIKASSNSTSDSTTFTGKQNKSSKSSHQVSSSSSSSSDSSTGIATRRSTRSHERAKAKQLQQKEDLAKTESGNGCFEEVEDTVGMDDQLAKDNTKLALNDLSKQHSPSSRAETVTAHSSGGPPSPCSSVSRRALRQGQPMPAPESQPYILTCSSLEHQGVQYEIGDIVSLLDKDGGVYYAILRGFMCDQYANKFTILTWLLPTVPNPNHFDPALFILGPEEDVPRSMDQIDFVCHSPQSRHFQNSYTHNLQEAEFWLSSVS